MTELDYQVAICSYARQETIKRATLATLEKAGVDPDRITIFVPNAEQRYDYEDTLGQNKYRMVVTAPGLFKSRQLAHKYYVGKGMEGTPLIHMDDDIWGFLKVVDDETQTYGRAVLPYEGTLDHIAQVGFGLAKSLGTGLWGLTYMNNPFYMDHTVSVGNMLVNGGFQGVYAGDDIFIGPRRTYVESAEEDGETSLQAFTKYGKVIKFSYLAINVNNPDGGRVEPGGIRAEIRDAGFAETDKEAVIAREQTNEAAFDMLVERYPGLVRTYRSKKGRLRLHYKNMGNMKIPSQVVEAEFGGQG